MAKRTYKQFCPTARALNVVGDRWTLLIVRNLLTGPRRYTDLRSGLPGMASNLLAQRLAEMEDAGLLTKERREDPAPRTVYDLTPRGRELRPVVVELARFGLPYLDLPTDEEPMEPEQVPLGLLALMHPAEAPDEGLRIRCSLDEGDHTVTLAPAGPAGARRTLDQRATVSAGTDGEADVTITGTMAGLLWVRQGILDGQEAIDQGLVQFSGAAEPVATAKRIYRFTDAS